MATVCSPTDGPIPETAYHSLRMLNCVLYSLQLPTITLVGTVYGVDYSTSGMNAYYSVQVPGGQVPSLFALNGPSRPEIYPSVNTVVKMKRRTLFLWRRDRSKDSKQLKCDMILYANEMSWTMVKPTMRNSYCHCKNECVYIPLRSRILCFRLSIP